MKNLLRYLRSNKGDANVSKMAIIAIVFVVGAILLVLTTSAFRNPINRWFDDVTISSDGRTITTSEGLEFKAYLQGDPDMPNIPKWQLPWN